MGYSKIERKFYDEGIQFKPAHAPVYDVYETFLYININKGSFPKYKIVAGDREFFNSKISELLFNNSKLKNIAPTVHYYSNIPHDECTCLDLDTGELL